MSYFVVGTDTGIGKTVVTAGLVGWHRRAGLEATAVKPCQTGYPEDDDARFVQSVCEDDAGGTCLERLGPALAPAVAARETGTKLSDDRILAGCRAAIETNERAIVEGIGGLRVPLTETTEVVDLVTDLDLPTLVVARSGLGTLNHTALTVEALENRGVSVRGIVLNQYEGATVAERTNPGEIERMTDAPVWTLPPIDSEPGADLADNGDAVIDAVASALPDRLLDE